MVSPRQRQTLALLRQGECEKRVAAALGVKERTAHEYVVALYRKYRVHTRAELLAVCSPPRSARPSAAE